MIDFHTHTFFSDGILSCAEHVRRAVVAGYKVIGITDHVDFSNFEFIYNSINKFVSAIDDCGWDIKVIPGVELTHIPCKKIKDMVAIARGFNIPLVIFHGESPVEPVEKGSNRAAIEAGVDILAHPGLILPEDVKLAASNNVNLEITARKGHCITNGHVAKLAVKYNAPMVLDTDAHDSTDFFTPDLRQKVLKGCGLDDNQISIIEENINNFAKKIIDRMK